MPKIKVCARFRPLSSKERSDHGDTVSLRAIDSKSFTFKDETEEEVEFRFDRVFYQGSGQDEIYEFLVLPIVKGVFNGVNGAIITYGQTGAGKTYSMEGPSITDSDEKQKGLLPRVVDGLFNNIKLSDEITECTIKLSMGTSYSSGTFLIYQFTDQGEQSAGNICEWSYRDLHLRFCRGITESFKMNMASSRSHCIYIFLIEQEVKKEKRSGKLILVDLAGSEKAEKTGAEGRVL
ncbi:hypothetical protein BUALT_Bualt01G0192400 [Buddleja alternifolia]|uniref:Kinesin motor domain-containing protein n=1 Tax=Buddleja alternifolia TaxID=168488 RepID=A0AAV6YAR5_9LAMI|nr:hypothetical protein BUALT_Bualt01G0192400 [Buddleja alternifolia]